MLNIELKNNALSNADQSRCDHQAPHSSMATGGGGRGVVILTFLLLRRRWVDVVGGLGLIFSDGALRRRQWVSVAYGQRGHISMIKINR